MDVAVILIGKRVESAVKVQQILTDHGDVIKTRLGINRELSKDDNAAGFIFLELCGDQNQVKNLCDGLNAMGDVKAECLKMEIPGSGCGCGCC